MNGKSYRVRHIFCRRTPPPPKLNLPLINFGVINFLWISARPPSRGQWYHGLIELEVTFLKILQIPNYQYQKFFCSWRKYKPRDQIHRPISEKAGAASQSRPLCLKSSSDIWQSGAARNLEPGNFVRERREMSKLRVNWWVFLASGKFKSFEFPWFLTQKWKLPSTLGRPGSYTASKTSSTYLSSSTNGICNQVLVIGLSTTVLFTLLHYCPIPAFKILQTQYASSAASWLLATQSGVTAKLGYLRPALNTFERNNWNRSCN